MTEEPKEPKEPDNTSKFLLAGCLGPVLLFAGCVAMVAVSGGDSDEPSGDMARVMCEGFVEDRLKSPGSADFQRPVITGAGVNTWKVSGSVDAENSFGGTVRLDYACTVRGDGSGEWTLLDLQHSQR